MNRMFRWICAASLVVSAAACGGVEPRALGKTSAALTEDDGDQGGRGPQAHASVATSATTLVHAVAGDGQVMFVAEPLVPAVAVYSQHSGRQIGTVPAPPGGFLLPFMVRVPHSGHLVVLDPGGFPNPFGISVPRVYDYTYNACDDDDQGFSATLTRTVRFDNLPVVFAEDLEVLPDGTELMSESIIGAIWVISPSGVISPGLFPDNPGAPIPQLAPCAITTTTVGTVPFESGGDFGPGVGALAASRGYLYFGSTCLGGVQRIPVASLTDATRTPQQRADDITTVSAKPAGVPVEAFEGLAFNRFSEDDQSLYASNSFQLGITKIDVDTGARQVVATDATLFNFPVGLQFVPGRGDDGATLLVASDQEYRWTAINAAITQDEFQPPWLVTQVRFDH